MKRCNKSKNKDKDINKIMKILVKSIKKLNGDISIKLTNILESKKIYSHDLYECNWTILNDKYKLISLGSVCYMILKNKNIISVLYAPRHDLQMGDDRTDIWLINKKDVVINNDGDVSSVIIFKCLL